MRNFQICKLSYSFIYKFDCFAEATVPEDDVIEEVLITKPTKKEESPENVEATISLDKQKVAPEHDTKISIKKEIKPDIKGSAEDETLVQVKQETLKDDTQEVEKELVETIPEAEKEQPVTFETATEKEDVDVPKIDEHKPVVEESVEVDVVESPAQDIKEEETPEIEKKLEEKLDEKTEDEKRRTSVSKLKKKKKKKTDDVVDEYTQKLMEQEIPKTELEKFEKPVFEKPTKKPELEKTDLLPLKVEHKEQKPTKVNIVPVEELPQPIKLKAKKPKHIEPEVEEKTIQPRLKSRITYVDIEKPLHMKTTEIGAVKDHGELSRNVEEAEEVLKLKIKKFKHKPKRKDSLERPQLEVYEKYESSSDESTTKERYKRPEKDLPKDEVESKTLKIGTLIYVFKFIFILCMYCTFES